MNQNDIMLAGGGLTAPLWLPTLTQWVALIVGIFSVVYLGFKIYKAWKER